MKNLRLVFLFLPVFVFFVSCKKDKSQEQAPAANPGPVAYTSYSSLAIGNYWIYQVYDVDSLGNATATSTYDSCYISGDTVINSYTYYKMYRPNYAPAFSTSYLRDSLHYIVNSGGEILFSSQDFTSNFVTRYSVASPGDTICKITRKMTDQNLSVTVGAGTFSTMNAKETYNMYPNWSYAGNPRYRHFRYAANIGIVVETKPFFASDPKYKERRLVSYHLN